MEKVLFATDELTGLMHIFFLTFIAEWIISGDVANPILPVWLAIPVIGLLTFLCCAVGLLDDEGKMKGSMLVMEFESRQELDEYLANEPYVQEHVWEKIEVEPINVVIR